MMQSMFSKQRSYVGVLTKFAEDLEEPFNKFIQFTDNTSKALEEICGHYVDSESHPHPIHGTLVNLGLKNNVGTHVGISVSAGLKFSELDSQP